MSDWEDAGCSCHISPPCGFCTSLTEGEADAYANGGLQGLKEYRDSLED